MTLGWPTYPTLVLLLGLASAAPAQQTLVVPSGQPITLNEVLVDDSPGETWVRFRFVAPEIGTGAGAVSYDTAAPDMDHLCEYLALPYLTEYTLTPARVVISLSDRLVPFGDTNPDATQYFEAYRPENARCIWEAF